MNQTIAEATVGQLVVERPSRARLFERLGIDYCCGGKMPLAEACQAKGLDTQAVLAELEQEAQGPGEQAQRNWATASLTDLANHIEQTHHAYMKEELPRLEMLAEKVAQRHGPGRPELQEIHRVFLGMKAELESHMMKEEQVLFPMCRVLDVAEELPSFHCGSVERPIEVMVQEHDDAGDALERLRELSGDYEAPADACNTFRALYDSLRQLEEDLHQHIHKENNILFPRAVRLEKLLSR